MTPVPPEKTFAIVVGIESYSAGETWNLDGPAADACRFAEWLCGRGVPASNVSLHLSALAKNAGLALPDGVIGRDATANTFEKLMTELLPTKRESQLILYWGGHGVMQADDARYLFTQDASSSNKRTVPLNDLLKYLRSSAMPSPAFSQQIAIVDACANFAEARTMATALTAMQFPHGQSVVADRSQFTLMAARPGERASNLNSEQTGLFSRELRDLLASQPSNVWPPDMEIVTNSLIERFVQLRDEDKAKQTPAYFSAGQWGTSERTIGSVTNQSIASASHMEVSIPDKRRLIKALSRCPVMTDYLTRKRKVLSQVRFQITARIPDEQDGLGHADAIVSTCMRYVGGLTELLRSVRFYDEGSSEMSTLDGLFQEIVPQAYVDSMTDQEPA